MTGDTTPRWLSPGEQRAWRAYRAASLLLEDVIDRGLQREARMPHLYYSVLATLSETPGHRLRMTDLAEQLKITRSRLTYAVGRLEKDGSVRREGCAADGRGSTAVLTEAGFDLVRRTAPGHVETVRAAVFDHLTPEQVGQLEEICDGIARAIQGDGPRTAESLPWRRRSTPSAAACPEPGPPSPVAPPREDF